MSPLQRMREWPQPGAATVVDVDEVLHVTENGPDDRAGSPVTGGVFEWASVTKLLTSLATLVAVQEGLLSLDTPAGPPGSTIRHLLAHASGLAPEGTSVVGPPGRRRVYSNSGFDVLGRALEAAVGTSFGPWLDRKVLASLRLTGVRFEGSPARGARGTIHDLGRLGQELLRPTLLEPELFAMATRPVFPDLSGVLPGFGRQSPNEWGLGFEIRGHKSPHWTGSANSPETFGHFGQSGSFLWVDPQAGLACGGLASRPFGPWAAASWPKMSDDVLAHFRRP